MTVYEIEAIKRQWEAGVAIEQIVRTMPYKRATAFRYVWELRREGVLPDRPRKNGRELVVEAYKSGMHNPYEIAEMYGFAYKTVTNYLSEAKLDRPQFENGKLWVKRDYNSKTKKILDCLASGASISETARRFGVSRQWVSVVKKRSDEENE